MLKIYWYFKAHYGIFLVCAEVLSPTKEKRKCSINGTVYNGPRNGVGGRMF